MDAPLTTPRAVPSLPRRRPAGSPRSGWLMSTALLLVVALSVAGSVAKAAVSSALAATG
jgi:hypothetical protein